MGRRSTPRTSTHGSASFDFDVAVCFETLEHVEFPGRLAEIIAKARRAVLVSVPIVPTVGINEFHLHDFTEESLEELIGLPILEKWPQPSERSCVWAFGR